MATLPLSTTMAAAFSKSDLDQTGASAEEDNLRATVSGEVDRWEQYKGG